MQSEPDEPDSGTHADGMLGCVQLQASHTEHIPSREQWESNVQALLASLNPSQQAAAATPSFLNLQEASMAREEYARGGQGSLDDILEALDGGLEVKSWP